MYLIVPVNQVKLGCRFRYNQIWYFKYNDIINRTENTIGWNSNNIQDFLDIKNQNFSVGVEIKNIHSDEIKKIKNKNAAN